MKNQEPPAEYNDAKLTGNLSAKIPKSWRTVFFYGPPGTGKTHCIWAMQRKANGWLALCDEWEGQEFTSSDDDKSRQASLSCQLDGLRNKKAKVYIISECSGIDRHRYDHDYIDGLCIHPGPLAIDDVGYKKPNEWNVQALYEITTRRRASDYRTVITSNLTPDRVKELYGAAIASRLTCDVVIPTGGDDRRKHNHQGGAV